MKLLAAQLDIYEPFSGEGPLGNVTGGSAGFINRFSGVISSVIGVVTICAGLWFLVQIFTGAYAWLASGSDKSSLDSAKKKITNASVGLFLVVASYTIAAIAGSFLGLNIIDIGPTIFGLAPT